MLSIIKEIKLTNIIQNNYDKSHYNILLNSTQEIEIYNLDVSKIKYFQLQQYWIISIPIILKYCKIITYEILYHISIRYFNECKIKNSPNIFKGITQHIAFNKYFNNEIKKYNSNFYYDFKTRCYQFRDW
jgi:hypothetical protein